MAFSARIRATPPPGTMPLSRAACTAFLASSSSYLRSFISVSVAAPQLIWATPPASLASRSCSFSRSYSLSVRPISSRICWARPAISSLLPAPPMMIVSSDGDLDLLGPAEVGQLDAFQLDAEVLEDRRGLVSTPMSPMMALRRSP